MFYNLFYILFYKILSLIKKIINIPRIIIRTIIKNIKKILLVILFICILCALILLSIKETRYQRITLPHAGQLYYSLYINEFKNNPNLKHNRLSWNPDKPDILIVDNYIHISKPQNIYKFYGPLNIYKIKKYGMK